MAEDEWLITTKQIINIRRIRELRPLLRAANVAFMVRHVALRVAVEIEPIFSKSILTFTGGSFHA
jgi:hypothetical protein